jgi:hypothetical protein
MAAGAGSAGIWEQGAAARELVSIGPTGARHRHAPTFNAISLFLGCSAGELGSLEQVVKEFLDKGFLTPITLHEMWGIADKAYDAMARGAAQADRQAWEGWCSP